MRHLDFTPLYRSSVGYDHLCSMVDALTSEQTAQTYPPYNIERKSENSYRITMAVAGFTQSDLDIEAESNVLTIKGAQAPHTDDKVEILHRGIATRSFERSFQLADYVEVKSAKLENGLLHIDLEKELPEKLKPRKVEIKADSADQKQLEAKSVN